MARPPTAAEQPAKARYLFASGLALRPRLALAGALLLAGMAVEFWLASLPGLLIYLVGLALLLLRPVSNERATVPRKKNWERVTLDEFNRLAALYQHLQEAKRRAGRFTPTSCLGCLGLVGYLVLVAAGAAAILAIPGIPEPNLPQDFLALLTLPPASEHLFVAWIVNSLLLLIPFWLSGFAMTWEPPHLSLKLEALLNVYKEAQRNRQLPVQCIPMLELAGGKAKRIPTDCRMLFEFTGAPRDFIGVQVQVSINTVQSRPYPYLYCVLLARPPFGLPPLAQQFLQPPPKRPRLALFKASDPQEKKEARFSRYEGEIVEIETGGEVDVVVIRQLATGTGYHTQPDQQVRVWSNAMRLAQQVLAAQPVQKAAQTPA